MLVDKPQQQPTTGPNTTLPSFSLRNNNPTTSTALHLVECIISQNSTLKGQINHIEAELDKSQQMSSGLLRENESLRSLYKERTKDISKLVKTISFQSHENQSDIKHQCHLLQQLNFATLKEIKRLDKQIKQTATRSQQQSNSIDRFVELKNEVDHDSLNKIRARINNGVSHESIGKKKRKMEDEMREIEMIQREVNDLVIQNSALCSSIEQLKNSEGPERYAITQEKQEYQERLTAIIEENKRYIEQLNVDKTNLEKVQSQFRTKEELFAQCSFALTTEMKKYETLNKQWADINAQRDNLKLKIAQSTQKQQKKQDQVKQLRGVKTELIRKIDNIKKNRRNIQEQTRNREQQLNKQKRDAINKILKQISTNEMNTATESQKIQKEKQNFEGLIIAREADAQSLEEQVSQYAELVRQYPNPICEIERIELMLRLKKKK